MGEYINETKLGTCESLYYCSYEQLKNTVEFTKGQKAPFLKLDSGYRFRFPFPDENISIGCHEDFDRGYLLEVPENIGVEITHGKVFHRVGYSTYAGKKAPHYHEYGFSVPCCQDKEAKEIQFNRWSNAGRLLFEIVQQKYTSQQGAPMLVTVVRFPYCGTMCQLSKEEVVILLNHFSDVKEPNKEIIEILNICLSGYEVKELV